MKILTEQQKEAQKWWRSLSMNEWKALEKKHKAITVFGYGHCGALDSEIKRMYVIEHKRGFDYD